MAIADVWKRVEAWLASNAPDVLGSLQPPASRGDIAALETEVNVAIPPDFKASLAQHDGQLGTNISGLFPYSGMFGPEPAWQLMSIAESIREWKMLRQLLDGGDFAGNTPKPATGVQAAWWHKGWIPIAGNGGDSVCLDMNPAGEGTVGQVILFQHDGPKRSLFARSFESWLAELAVGMESGRYKYDEDERNLIDA